MKENDNWWLGDYAEGADKEYQRWFLRTFQRLCRKVRDPRELARRLAAVRDEH